MTSQFAAPGDSLPPPAFPGLDQHDARIHESLRVVRDELHADEATILLLDDSGNVLEPVASVGLGRTPRGAARVPLGRGFAGQIALTRQPRSIAEVTESNVVNPVLFDHGIRSLLGVPVFSGSQLLGVLHVGLRTHKEFSAEELATLTSHAAVLGRSIQERRNSADHTAALVLQRSLLPSTPAPIDGFDVAARYIPAEGDLGGDWYDVFKLPDGAVGFVMGDVVGHGLQAAVVMGRLRSALRAYALDHASPAEVLRRLDRKISYFEDGAFATVLYGVASPPFDEVVFSCAGHWAPLVTRPDEPAYEAQLTHDVMLGIGDLSPRHDNVVELPPHTSLCLYTDGLIERRERGHMAGSDPTTTLLHAVLANFDATDSAEEACRRIVAATVGDDVTEDDTALLVIQRTAQG